MGTNKNPAFTETLCKIKLHCKEQDEFAAIGKFPAELKPEPHNPVDAKAIAFVVTVDDQKQCIGYAVREVLDEVHNAIAKNLILGVRIAWIKYIVDWPRSGPGWYCGVNISKNGEWSRTVVSRGSTR